MKKKDVQNGKETFHLETNMSLFLHNMLFILKFPQNWPLKKKSLRTKKQVYQSCSLQDNIQKSTAFLCTSNEQLEFET